MTAREDRYHAARYRAAAAERYRELVAATHPADLERCECCEGLGEVPCEESAERCDVCHGTGVTLLEHEPPRDEDAPLYGEHFDAVMGLAAERARRQRRDAPDRLDVMLAKAAIARRAL